MGTCVFALELASGYLSTWGQCHKLEKSVTKSPQKTALHCRLELLQKVDRHAIFHSQWCMPDVSFHIVMLSEVFVVWVSANNTKIWHFESS